MLSSRGSLIFGLVALALCNFALAVDFVELSDKNQATLGLDLSKALKSVQESLVSEFKFKKVHEALKFVQSCALLKSVVAGADDSDYEGLVGKIKAVLAEPSLDSACKVKSSDLMPYVKLDDELGEFSYLTQKKFVELTGFAHSLSEQPLVRSLLGDLFDKTTALVTKKLLAGASDDVRMLFDETYDRRAFEFKIKYKSGCSISTVHPLCKLVRRTQVDDVTALGVDFAEFAEALKSNDESKVSAYSKASGVDLDTMKTNCSKALKSLRAMERINNYKDANMLSQSQIDEQCQADSSFDLFYNLYEMCLVAVSKQ